MIMLNFYPTLRPFTQGNLRECLLSWRKITIDINILDYVSAVKISFEESLVPCQSHYRPSVFNAQEELIVQQEIKTLLEKGVNKFNAHIMNLLNTYLQFFLDPNLMGLFE